MNIYNQLHKLNESDRSVSSLIATGLTKIMNEQQRPQEAIQLFKQFLTQARHSLDAQKELAQELVRTANHHLSMQRKDAAVVALNVFLNLLPHHEKAKDIKDRLNEIKASQQANLTGKFQSGPQASALKAYLSDEERTNIKKTFNTTNNTSQNRLSRFSKVDTFLETRRIKLTLAPDDPKDAPRLEHDAISGLSTLSQRPQTN